jgi:hypothetical protein
MMGKGSVGAVTLTVRQNSTTSFSKLYRKIKSSVIFGNGNAYPSFESLYGY